MNGVKETAHVVEGEEFNKAVHISIPLAIGFSSRVWICQGTECDFVDRTDDNVVGSVQALLVVGKNDTGYQ